MLLLLLSDPTYELLHARLGEDRAQGVVVPTQLLLREGPVQVLVTRAAEPYAPVGHVEFIEALFEPLVAVVGARDEVVESEELVAGAHGAAVGFSGFSKDAHNLLILSAKYLTARCSRYF